MVDPAHRRLSISRQCELVGIARSSFYYEGKGETRFNLELMRRIDEQFMETPWYGARQMVRHDNVGFLAHISRQRNRGPRSG